MGIQIKSKTEIFKIPISTAPPTSTLTNLPADTIGTTADKTATPIVGSWFRIEKGPEATPPKYEYDEVGVMIEGEINLRDENGHTATVKAGDVFFFPRGSTITFSTGSYGLAWKCGGRIWGEALSFWDGYCM
ncbi:hypothetical protein BDV25DRAFT_141473 [Aspergillus avenaceus]|uniref:(S)-ureidoglycine aminohydrolase cupin domain-containing protein n=1 Tax=Aspergillus avenaceus TaxID=36643 RepID=A0A5N6TQV5_ASPAV|nr:hypothetical protein BDV25DRAFT_141473 [Aspergillus avenaceus]